MSGDNQPSQIYDPSPSYHHSPPPLIHSKVSDPCSRQHSYDMASFGTSVSQVSNSFWGYQMPTSYTHPRTIPSSIPSQQANYPPLVSHGYGMNLVVSPPLGSSGHKVPLSETDPYHPPPLSSRPGTGGSDEGSRARSPLKKRKAGEGKLPTFLVKLYELLRDPSRSHLLSWDDTGNYIVAYTSKPELLDLLKTEYNQNRVASFTRQLNIYGWMRDNITRNTEPTDPTLWRHDSLNRNSTHDDLLQVQRRVAPRISQAEKRRKAEEAGSSSPEQPPQLQWPLAGGSGGFSMGTSSLDHARSLRLRRPRSRRHSDPESPNPLAIPTRTQTMGETSGMMSFSAPTSATAPFFPMPNNSTTSPQFAQHFSSLSMGFSPSLRYVASGDGTLFESSNSPQYQPRDPETWVRTGLATLGGGLRPFEPAPLATQIENSITTSAAPGSFHALANDFKYNFGVPPHDAIEPAPASSSGTRGSPSDTIVVTPPPPVSQTLRPETVVPGAYSRTGAFSPNQAPDPLPGLGRLGDVLAPRSSSVLQRFDHGQSGPPFMENDEVPSSSLPQPHLFESYENEVRRRL